MRKANSKPVRVSIKVEKAIMDKLFEFGFLESTHLIQLINQYSEITIRRGLAQLKKAGMIDSLSVPVNVKRIYRVSAKGLEEFSLAENEKPRKRAYLDKDLIRADWAVKVGGEVKGISVEKDPDVMEPLCGVSSKGMSFRFLAIDMGDDSRFYDDVVAAMKAISEIVSKPSLDIITVDKNHAEYFEEAFKAGIEKGIITVSYKEVII